MASPSDIAARTAPGHVDAPPPSPVRGRVLIVGAGLMGVGIAQLFALAGHRVDLVDAAATVRATALDRCRTQCAALVATGMLTADRVDDAIGRIEVGVDIEGSPAANEGCVLAVEAAPEELAVKRALFAVLDRVTPPTTLLGTNSSGLSIGAIADGLSHPERVCGLHFWNPPLLVPLVEVVYGPATAAATAERACELLVGAGKRPVVVRRDVPGFIGNRLQHALQREAMALVAQGVASAEDVDLVVTQGFGRRLGVVGPLAVCDLAGLDLVLDVDAYLLRDLNASPDPSPLLVDLVARGRLGVKSGAGFLEWTPAEIDRVMAARDAALVDAMRKDGAAPGESPRYFSTGMPM